MTDMKRERMSPIESMYEDMITTDILDMANLLGLSPVAAMGIVGRVTGRIAACLDESMKDNPELAEKMCLPGLAYKLTGSDTHETFMINYNALRENHILHHVTKRNKGTKEADELFERLKRSMDE